MTHACTCTKAGLNGTANNIDLNCPIHGIQPKTTITTATSNNPPKELPPTQQAAIKAILLQFNAEQHQGLNELAGHGTALDQAVKQFSELLQAAATQRAIEARLDTATTALRACPTNDKMLRECLEQHIVGLRAQLGGSK